MTSTPVGMRCPECTRERTVVKNIGGRPGSSDAPATYVFIGLCVLGFLGQLATGGDLFRGGGTLGFDGLFFAPFADAGEWYRTVSYGFLHSGVLHLGLNLLALYILGSLLEPAIGTRRFVAIFVISVLGGALGVALIEPGSPTVGASGGVFGLMAAAFLIARDRGMDELASQIGFFVVINLVFTFSVPRVSIGGHIGGLLAGAAVAFAISTVGRRRGTQPQPGLEAIVLLGILAAVVVATVVAVSGTSEPTIS